MTLGWCRSRCRVSLRFLPILAFVPTEHICVSQLVWYYFYSDSVLNIDMPSFNVLEPYNLLLQWSSASNFSTICCCKHTFIGELNLKSVITSKVFSEVFWSTTILYKFKLIFFCKLDITAIYSKLRGDWTSCLKYSAVYPMSFCYNFCIATYLFICMLHCL